jgi:hypothetical protein
MYLRYLSLFIAIPVILNSCIKVTDEEEEIELQCNAIKGVQLSTNSPVMIGDELKINATEVGGYRIYHWTGPDLFQSQDPANSMTATMSKEGWYYLSLSNPDCETKVDSIYVDVKIKPGTAPCTVSNNTATYSNLGNDNFTSVSKTIDASTSLLKLRGSGSGAELQVFFHPHWRTSEPEDGMYKTTNNPILSTNDGNYNKVFISTVKSSIYWACHDFQDVYVSHVNGKLRVQFCSVTLSGSNGSNSFTTVVSTQMTQN